MKKTLIALAMLVAIPTAMAGFGPGGDGAGHGRMHGPNVERMAVMLDLTPEQQDKMKALFAEQAKKRDETRAAMRTEMQSKMQAILTPAQFEKMTKLRGERGTGMGGRGMREGCDGTGPRR